MQVRISKIASYAFLVLFLNVSTAMADELSLTSQEDIDLLFNPYRSEEKTYSEESLVKVTFPDAPKLDPDGELQAWLFKNQLAPFDGVLLSPEAVAHILSEYHGQRKRGEAALQKQREADLSVLKLETDQLKLDLKSTREKATVYVNSEKKENARLQKINKDLREDRGGNFFDDLLKFTAGAGVGAILMGILLVL